MNAYVNSVLNNLANYNQPVFLQAATEVIRSLEPILSAQKKIRTARHTRTARYPRKDDYLSCRVDRRCGQGKHKFRLPRAV